MRCTASQQQQYMTVDANGYVCQGGPFVFNINTAQWDVGPRVRSAMPVQFQPRLGLCAERLCVAHWPASARPRHHYSSAPPACLMHAESRGIHDTTSGQRSFVSRSAGMNLCKDDLRDLQWPGHCCTTDGAAISWVERFGSPHCEVPSRRTLCLCLADIQGARRATRQWTAAGSTAATWSRRTGAQYCPAAARRACRHAGQLARRRVSAAAELSARPFDPSCRPQRRLE